MNEWLQNLVELQEKDLSAARLKEQIKSIPEKMREAKKQYEKENQDWETAKKNFQDAELAYRKFEVETAALQEQKRNFQSKSMLIKNNDDYRAAMLQIELCDKAIDELEEKQLEAMINLDSLKAVVKEKEQELAAGKQRAEEIQADLQRSQANSEQRISELLAERPALAGRIPPALLARYERLSARWQSGPISPYVVCIEGRSCGRCHIELPNQVVSNARKYNPQDEMTDQDIISCANCSAMLYVE